MLTEPRIQTAWWGQYGGNKQMVVPNVHIPMWWECDLWVLLRSGYTAEYEIKLSVRDFKADFKKRWGFDNKHELMENRSTRAPNRYFFILPKGLEVEVPAYAGEIRVWEDERGDIVFRTMKNAKRLHNNEAPETVVNHATTSIYYRYWSLRMNRE
ncbi:MAG: hypothetical protein GY869_00755 [Planctomycetes bacterium]|nr:hypothetical protein [Planctomycetota bacterium]